MGRGSWVEGRGGRGGRWGFRDTHNIVCGRCSVSLITQFRRSIYLKNINNFRHLKLEIALAIPASNDEKYN